LLQVSVGDGYRSALPGTSRTSSVGCGFEPHGAHRGAPLTGTAAGRERTPTSPARQTAVGHPPGHALAGARRGGDRTPRARRRARPRGRRALRGLTATHLPHPAGGTTSTRRIRSSPSAGLVPPQAAQSVLDDTSHSAPSGANSTVRIRP